MSVFTQHPQDADALERARALVLRYGWNSAVYQILNPGIRYWFSGAGDAVVGYAEHSGVRVVAGAPVCASARLGAVAREFEEDATRDHLRVLYFGAEARLEAVYQARSGCAQVVLGAQPVWNPQAWAAHFEARSSLRAQRNRARNKGVAVSAWEPQAAQRHPALRRCLREWLETKGLPPLHFLVEPETLGRLADRRIFVAQETVTQGGVRVVGFLIASPVPERQGWLIEQVIRGRGAPNGTAELLIDTAMRALASEGSRYVTLGVVPLAKCPGLPQTSNPLWLRLFLGWVRAHGRRFYNFEGLEFFKAKFQPLHWEPVFALANAPHFSPRMLYAVAGAFSGGLPLQTVTKALGKAAGVELRTVLARVRKP